MLDTQIMIDTLTADTHQIIIITRPLQKRFLTDPYSIFEPRQSALQTIQVTLIHLLEFEAAFNLDSPPFTQIPAIPRLETNPAGDRGDYQVQGARCVIQRRLRSLLEAVPAGCQGLELGALQRRILALAELHPVCSLRGAIGLH